MATLEEALGTDVGNSFNEILVSEDIIPGDQPSYELCKQIYMYHPLGRKMTHMPIQNAMSLPRNISIPDGPEDTLTKAFCDEWKRLKCDEIIKYFATMAKVYGIAAVGIIPKDKNTQKPVKFENLYKEDLTINVFDPLNTSGSFVTSQDPNDPGYQDYNQVVVFGKPYNRTRTCVLMNEEPIYLKYTSSAYGYTGRSVYQRALFPLKTYINAMITDDLVIKKVGVFIEKIKQPGSVVDNKMRGFFAKKRDVLKESKTDNVISIGIDEAIETLNLQNMDGPFGLAYGNVIKNIAASTPMPAILLTSQSFAQGFADGTEDAKQVAEYLNTVRSWLQPAYNFFDKIVMYKAWNPEFYASVQAEFPEYKGVDYEAAFMQWRESFTAEWPSLLQEPDSEKIKVDQTRMNSVIAILNVMLPYLDDDGKRQIMDWAQDNINTNAVLFPSPLVIDTQAMEFPEIPIQSGQNEIDKDASNNVVGMKNIAGRGA